MSEQEITPAQQARAMQEAIQEVTGGASTKAVAPVVSVRVFSESIKNRFKGDDSVIKFMAVKTTQGENSVVEQFPIAEYHDILHMLGQVAANGSTVEGIEIETEEMFDEIFTKHSLAISNEFGVELNKAEDGSFRYGRFIVRKK